MEFSDSLGFASCLLQSEKDPVIPDSQSRLDAGAVATLTAGGPTSVGWSVLSEALGLARGRAQDWSSLRGLSSL